eukprot:928267-Pyramimonas_sp.AAC.1
MCPKHFALKSPPQQVAPPASRWWRPSPEDRGAKPRPTAPRSKRSDAKGPRPIEAIAKGVPKLGFCRNGPHHVGTS